VRSFAVKVELVTAAGDHLRYVPAAVAKSMIDAGHAEVAHQNGKIRSVKLVSSASTHAARIGEPSPPSISSPRFVRRAKLDFPATLWEHHPRATYE